MQDSPHKTGLHAGRGGGAGAGAGRGSGRRNPEQGPEQSPERSGERAGERSGDSRERILNAALKEFSEHGLAGARTDRIARAAGVNKALLYYYFESKEKLYEAALEMISAKIRDRSMALMQRDATPGERLLRAALDHFDRILAQQEFQSLMQQEMMRIHRGESGAMAILVKRVFAPLMTMSQSLVREGMESGELIGVEPLQVLLGALGANVFYFLSAPVWRLILQFEPFAPEALAARRRALVEFLGQALFQDRAQGAAAAARVLADMPMPEIPVGRRFFGGKSDERS
ncbi:MAG TPA: TetR/AcrR family transcriptional regulator [Terracidiphilus sp.]|nr:TetR/AcrR family transcriptional regulator [Terracidiphilus sp.]